MKTTQTLLQSLSWTLLLGSLAACGLNHDPQRIFSAHEALNNKHRLVVSGLSDVSRQDILEANPNAKYRVLDKDLPIYEITGVEQKELEELSGDALIEKNEELSFDGAEDNSEVDHILLAQEKKEDESAQTKFLKGCIRHPNIMVPRTGLEILNKKNEAYFQPGDKIKLTAPDTIRPGTRLAWLVTPPKGSGQEKFFSEESEINLDFKMAGNYTVIVFYKTQPYCNYRQMTLSPTQNPALDYIVKTPERSDKNFYHLDAIKAPKAIETLEPKKDIVVAICDSGVNYNHPSLRESIWINPDEVEDGLDNDGNGYVDDVYGYDFYYGDTKPFDDSGHGSHVAGLISGYQTGAAYGVAKIMPLKVGVGQKMDLASIVACIAYAVQKEADIINLSVESQQPSKTIERLIGKAQEKGILVVVASGNGNRQGKGLNIDTTPRYPAAFTTSNILSVGASDEFGELTGYSNFGEEAVDIVAPGGYIDSDPSIERLIQSAYIENPEGILLTAAKGTSMATPIAAGAAALYMSEYLDSTPEDVISAFIESGVNTENLRGKIKSASLLDINAALSKDKSIILSDALL